MTARRFATSIRGAGARHSVDPARRAELERAFRATAYAADGIRLRVGALHPALDARLAALGLNEYAYLTAWNPGARERPEPENRAAQERLRARLARFAVLEGAAEGDDGSWSEPSFLALGIARGEAITIAGEFGQAAIVMGRRGGVPELVWV
jgi:hypothetical protein